MITPLFVAFPNSGWRAHVQATWNYLQSNYDITTNTNCGTHIHVSVEGGYSLEELKRVAQSAIHFETAFEALVPEHRRDPLGFARSSWIESHEFAVKGRSRAQSILMISQVPDFQSLLILMHPGGMRFCGWNFLSILNYYTIEFRKPPGSRTADEALAWAELAASFVQTSIRFGSPERLKLVPPTVGGLRWFLQQSFVLQLNEPERLESIWKDRHPNMFVEVKPMVYTQCKPHLGMRSEVQLSKIRETIEADRKKVIRFRDSTQEPYWPEERRQT
jgi:Putative amidoligase enzyme